MLLYAIVNFVNVILGSLRTIVIAKANRHFAAIINTVSFTFYAVVVKLTGGQEMLFILINAIIANFIGYYIADWIFSKTQKDKLWRISVTTYTDKAKNEIVSALKEYNLQYNETSLNTGKAILDIFSKTQAESRLAREILTGQKAKYHVMEIVKKL